MEPVLVYWKDTLYITYYHNCHAGRKKSPIRSNGGGCLKLDGKGRLLVVANIKQSLEGCGEADHEESDRCVLSNETTYAKALR